MAENIRDFRVKRQVSAQSVVEVIWARYPKFDKTLQSKCEHDDEYGVTITDDAMREVISAFAPELLETKRGDGHRLTCRISCRLESSDYEQLQQRIQGDGFATMQDWITATVRQYITTESEEISHE